MLLLCPCPLRFSRKTGPKSHRVTGPPCPATSSGRTTQVQFPGLAETSEVIWLPRPSQVTPPSSSPPARCHLGATSGPAVAAAPAAAPQLLPREAASGCVDFREGYGPLYSLGPPLEGWAGQASGSAGCRQGWPLYVPQRPVLPHLLPAPPLPPSPGHRHCLPSPWPPTAPSPPHNQRQDLEMRSGACGSPALKPPWLPTPAGRPGRPPLQPSGPPGRAVTAPSSFPPRGLCTRCFLCFLCSSHGQKPKPREGKLLAPKSHS